MELILYIAISMLIGVVLGWLLTKAKTASAIQAEKDAAQQKFNELEKEFVGTQQSTQQKMVASRGSMF